MAKKVENIHVFEDIPDVAEPIVPKGYEPMDLSVQKSNVEVMKYKQSRIKEMEPVQEPYDPNLVCPKCGKQYCMLQIQKLRRHIMKCSC